MVELLATHTLTSGVTGAAITDITRNIQSLWDDSLGLIGNSGGGLRVFQLDGKAYLRAVALTNPRYVLDMQRTGEWLVRTGNFNDVMYEFDKRSCTPGSLVASGATNFVAEIFVRAPDRYLRFFGNQISYKPLDLSGSWILEANWSISPTTHLEDPTVSRTRTANVLAVAYAGGAIFYYDVEAREQVGTPVYISDNQGAWYNAKRDVFIALGYPTATTVNVFASSVRPATISAVSALTPITQGKVSEVRVRLLGSNSDACAGELVDWNISAGGGALEQAQTETDADGYAYNGFVAPVSTTGSVTINAQVAF